MPNPTKKILKILKCIDEIYPDEVENEDENTAGRKQIYSRLSLFKIFILMKTLNIDSIKGIWRFLVENPKIRRACGLESAIDRSTLSRRLSHKIKPWF